MQRFIEYVLHEADQGRSRGEAMEHAIVTALNGKEKPQKGIPRGAGSKVVKSLRLTGKAQVLGAEQIDVSELWSQYWPDGKVPSSTKTPKTDIMIDLETLNTTPDSTILTIGAVKFDPFGDDILYTSLSLATTYSNAAIEMSTRTCVSVGELQK